MKKIIFVFILSILTLGLFACNISYGESFKSIEDLKIKMEENDIFLLYPEYFNYDEDNRDIKLKWNYVSNIDEETQEVIGYKIYCFSSPFYSAVYAYNMASDTILSDRLDRLTVLDDIVTDNGHTLEVYIGDDFKDSIFIIVGTNIDGKRYEARIKGNNQRSEGSYSHYIYKSGEQYDLAIEVLKQMIDSLE